MDGFALLQDKTDIGKTKRENLLEEAFCLLFQLSDDQLSEIFNKMGFAQEL